MIVKGNNMIRLNKYIASTGLCSRRRAEEYIINGKVRVNEKIVRKLATNINEIEDKVYIDGKIINLEQEKVYIMLNKPVGYVTTNKEQFNRPSTKELVKVNYRVFPIGRLDMNTEGLLLFTNDGDFSNKLMHPSQNIKKTYIAKIGGIITDEKIEALSKGVDIGGYITKKAYVENLGNNELKIVISEGKNRQVRKMCGAVNLKVIGLKRIKIGKLEIGNLKVGKYRYLTDNEIKSIFEL